VHLKSWDLCHLKGNHLSYPGKFESLYLHAQNNFNGISKFTEKNKTTEHFLKKNHAGQICPDWAEVTQIRPRSSMAAVTFEPASGARLSSALGYRIGTHRSWPSDQVEIYGQRSSSPRQKTRALAGLGFAGNGEGSPRALLVVEEG
jgi:hypothetical protein